MKNLNKTKNMELKKCGLLNPHPEKVKNSLFTEDEFFDSNDLIQVRYEMLRHTEKDGASITKAAKEFGLSRLTFYRIKSNFEKKAFAGLLPQQKGPKEGYKLTSEAVKFIDEILKENKNLKVNEIKKLIEEKFNIKIHKRSIERMIAGKKK